MGTFVTEINFICLSKLFFEDLIYDWIFTEINEVVHKETQVQEKVIFENMTIEDAWYIRQGM